MTKCIIHECQRTTLSQNQITELINGFHTSIGWDPVKKHLLSSSLLSSGTWGQIMEATSQALDKYSEGQISNTQEKVTFWNSNLGDTHANDKPLVDDIVGLFSRLRSLNKDIILAICTSDDRRATNSCMRNWNIEEYIDFSICGDEVLEGKPSVHPLLALCKQAKVLPKDCVIVGDTCADTGMGRNAKAGLIVGVLTGTGTREYLLDHGADVVIPNIDYLSGILSIMGRRPSYSDLTETTHYIGSDDSEYDY